MEIGIEIDGDSPEAVALALLRMVAEAEGKLDEDGMLIRASRAWLLDAYAECLAAVSGARIASGEDDDDDDDEDEDNDDGGDEQEDEDEDDGEDGDDEEEQDDGEEEEEKQRRDQPALRRR